MSNTAIQLNGSEGLSGISGWSGYSGLNSSNLGLYVGHTWAWNSWNFQMGAWSNNKIINIPRYIWVPANKKHVLYSHCGQSMFNGVDDVLIGLYKDGVYTLNNFNMKKNNSFSSQLLVNYGDMLSLYGAVPNGTVYKIEISFENDSGVDANSQYGFTYTLFTKYISL